jgi:hypothetical protein
MQELVGADAALTPSGSSGTTRRDPAAAQELFDQGKALMEGAKWAQACPKLLASLRLDPKPGAAFNLGECYEKNGQTASAWERYLEAATLSEQAGQADRAAYAREAAKALEPRLARLTIAVPVAAAGLVVRRDGAPVEAAAWGTAVPVDPGKHVLEAGAPGKAPWSKTVEVAPGDAAARIEVPELAEAAGSSATAPPAASRGSARKTAGAVLMGASAVGLVAGGVLVSVAHTQSGDLAARCPGHRCDSSLAPEISSYRAAGGGAVTAFILGGAVLGTGVAVFVTAPKANEGPAAFVAPRLGVGYLGIEGGFR